MGIVSAIAGLGSAILGYSSAKKQAQAQTDAANRSADLAQQGYQYALANPNIQQAQSQGTEAGSQYGALLGLGGDTNAANSAFQNYLNSSGYQFQQQKGMDSITGSAAAKGLLDSGSTLKALQSYGQGLGSSYFSNYMNRLQGVQQQGLNTSTGVANLASGAGAQAANAVQTGAANSTNLSANGTQALTSGLTNAVGDVGSYMRYNNPGLYTSLGGYVGAPGTVDKLTGYTVPAAGG
jgi:hypothetical protein